MSDFLWPHEPQHTRPPCPSPTPGVYSNPCPLSRWCHPTISSSVFPFSCPQFKTILKEVGNNLDNGHIWLFPPIIQFSSVQFSSVAQSCQTLCDPMNCSIQASLSITNSWSLLKLMSVESVMPSNHLILWSPLLLLPSVFPSIRVFSKESVLHIRWPKYWSFSFSISPSNEYSGLISYKMDWLGLLAV